LEGVPREVFQWKRLRGSGERVEQRKLLYLASFNGKRMDFDVKNTIVGGCYFLIVLCGLKEKTMKVIVFWNEVARTKLSSRKIEIGACWSVVSGKQFVS
jgi:hypothetical protein